MITIKDVAKEANVSTATVSYVINNTRYVSPELTEKVNKAIELLNYKPNVAARGLKTKKSQTIALICSDIANPFYAPLMKEVENSLSQKNYSLIICNTDENIEKEKMYIDIIMQKNVDGLIIAPTGKNLDIFDQLQDNDIPYVCVDRKIDGINCDFVLSENFKGAYEATKHLIKAGHKKIGIIVDDIQSGSERIQGYKLALEDFNINFNEDYISYGESSVIGGEKATEKLLCKNTKKRPTAIFSTMNLQTIGAMKTIVNLGYKCPSDISLIGFDDFEWANVFKPRLTTVVQFPNKIGKRAAEMLLKRINNKNKKGEVVRIDTNLKIRDTVKQI